MDVSYRRLRIILGQQDIACRSKLQAIGFCAQVKSLELLVGVVVGLARVQALRGHFLQRNVVDEAASTEARLLRKDS